MLGIVNDTSALVTLQIISIAMANTLVSSPKLIAIHVKQYLNFFQAG